MSNNFCTVSIPCQEKTNKNIYMLAEIKKDFTIVLQWAMMMTSQLGLFNGRDPNINGQKNKFYSGFLNCRYVMPPISDPLLAEGSIFCS